MLAKSQKADKPVHVDYDISLIVLESRMSCVFRAISLTLHVFLSPMLEDPFPSGLTNLPQFGIAVKLACIQARRLIQSPGGVGSVHHRLRGPGEKCVDVIQLGIQLRYGYVVELRCQ